MRAFTPIIAVLLLSVAGACEQHRAEITMSAAPKQLRLDVPDAQYHLTPEQRARVIADYDADALERLLGMVRPDVRDELLSFFVWSDQPASIGTPSRKLTELPDPQLQAVLEEVWAPYWDHLPAEALDREQAHLPGRDVARRRRELRQKQADAPHD